jgi:hypothetical protein
MRLLWYSPVNPTITLKAIERAYAVADDDNGGAGSSLTHAAWISSPTSAARSLVRLRSCRSTASGALDSARDPKLFEGLKRLAPRD